jgi:hypothetical protein
MLCLFIDAGAGGLLAGHVLQRLRQGQGGLYEVSSGGRRQRVWIFLHVVVQAAQYQGQLSEVIVNNTIVEEAANSVLRSEVRSIEARRSLLSGPAH